MTERILTRCQKKSIEGEIEVKDERNVCGSLK